MYPDSDPCLAQPAETFYSPDALRASLSNTADSAQSRINELEQELYAQRLLLDAAQNGLATIDQVKANCVPGGR